MSVECVVVPRNTSFATRALHPVLSFWHRSSYTMHACMHRLLDCKPMQTRVSLSLFLPISVCVCLSLSVSVSLRVSLFPFNFQTAPKYLSGMHTFRKLLKWNKWAIDWFKESADWITPPSRRRSFQLVFNAPLLPIVDSFQRCPLLWLLHVHSSVIASWTQVVRLKWTTNQETRRKKHAIASSYFFYAVSCRPINVTKI